MNNDDDLKLDWFQHDAKHQIIEKKRCALWADMSVGKTVTALSVIDSLMDTVEISRAVIIAPKEIAIDTWQDELSKWQNTLGSNLKIERLWNHPLLKPSLVKGEIIDGKQHFKWKLPKGLPDSVDVPKIPPRLGLILDPSTEEDFNHNERVNRRKKGLRAELISKTIQQLDGNVHVMTYEMLFDLIIGGAWTYEMMVLDESSSIKDPSTVRFKSLKKIVDRVEYVLELTATPSPQSMEHLYPQMFLLDKGEALGRTVTAFRERFFTQRPYGYGYDLNEGAIDLIYAQIEHLVIRQDAANLGLKLPEVRNSQIIVDLPPDSKQLYLTLEKKLVLKLEDGSVSAVNAGVLDGKLSQIANGAVYHDVTFDIESENEEGIEVREIEFLHDEKIKALRKWMNDNPTRNVLLAYRYIHDLIALRKAFPDMVKYIDDSENNKRRWNRGEIKLMVAHPKSCGHGLNLQYGGNTLMWYGINPSVELNIQMAGRLARRGQPEDYVDSIIIMAEGTKEQDRLESIINKEQDQQKLKDLALNKMKQRHSTLN